LAPLKGGHDPPFEEKRGSRQKKNQNVPTEYSSGIRSVNTEKYQKYQIGIQLYFNRYLENPSESLKNPIFEIALSYYEKTLF
jgi:hypothetical protein